MLKSIENDCQADVEGEMQLKQRKQMILLTFHDIDNWFNDYLIDRLLDNDEEAKLRYPTYCDTHKEKKED